MASPFRSQATLPGLPPQDPRERAADHRDRRRDALAFRSPELELSAPRALDAEADCLQAAGDVLAGVASLLSGARAPEHFRAALRGERHIWLVDLCRLATSPQHEAREAARCVLAVLERLVGEAPAARGTLVGQSTEAAVASARLLGMVAKAQEDGQLDDEERRTLARAAVDLQRTVAAIEALLHPEARR